MKPTLLLLIITLLLVACAPAATTPAPSTQPTTLATEEIVPTQPFSSLSPQPSNLIPTSEPAPGSNEDSAATYNAPAWATLPLTDARTGETFTLADYAGKTVFIEPMATWCTNCRRQIPNVETARQQLDSDQYVFIGLSVAENVDNATLAEYVEAQGWNFPFAVASADLTQGLIDSFGRTVVTPPSTPHFIIKPDGSLSEIQTGSHTAEDLIAELKG